MIEFSFFNVKNLRYRCKMQRTKTLEYIHDSTVLNSNITLLMANLKHITSKSAINFIKVFI
jgi:hypothetical protein